MYLIFYKYCRSNYWNRLSGGAVAAGVAEICTLPIDLVKVRLQVQVAGSQHRGVIYTFRSIVKNEGAISLWKGCSPSLVRQIGYSAVSVMLYQPIRNFISTDGSTTRFREKFLAGGIAGSIGIALFNPIEVVKVRMQADSQGKHYKNLRSGLKQILQSEGFSGLWKGLLPNIQRAFIVNAAELGTYDQSKHLLHQFNPNLFGTESSLTHFTASLVAGFFGAAGSNPVDIVKTRLMKQETCVKMNPLVAQWHCAYDIIKNEGVMSLYNGFVPNWMRKAPWCIIFFISFEKYLSLTSATKKKD